MADESDLRWLKGFVSRARNLMEQGSYLEALEELEDFEDKSSRWVSGNGEVQKVRDAARRLAGEIRGRMAEVVLKGPSLGETRQSDLWNVEIWPKKGPRVQEVLVLSDREAEELGSRISGLMRRKLVLDFTLDRWTSMPPEEFNTRVIERIESGTFD